MIENFLKKQEITKLMLFKYVSSNSFVDILHLSDTFHLSKSSIKRYLSDLNSLLASDSDTRNFQIKQNESFSYYLAGSNDEDININYLYFKIQLIFFNNSAIFQLFTILFNSEPITLIEVCKEISISENYCYRLVKKLNNIIKPYSMSISTKHNALRLLGRESDIRIVYFVIFTSIYQNLEWPFITISQKKAHTLSSFYNLNSYQMTSITSRIDFLLAILENRIHKTNYIQPMPACIDELTQVFVDCHDLTAELAYFPTNYPLIKNSTTEKNERLFFNLFVRIIDSSIDSDLVKITIGEKLAHLKHPLTDYYLALNQQFLKTFNLSNSKKLLYEFMYYTILHHVYSLYTCLDYQQIIQTNNFDYSSNIPEQINLFYTAFWDNSNVPNKFFTNYLHVCIQSILTSLFYIHKKNYLKIYIQYTKSSLGKTLIESQIKNFFNPESIQIIQKLDEADIVISDSNEKKINEIAYFFFTNINNNHSWSKLLAFIQQELFNLYVTPPID